MNKFVAELIGTFALVFCGAGSIIINEISGGAIGNTGIAMTFGFIVTVMIYSVGDISGAHFNPAVTIGFSVAKRFPVNKIPMYITAQILGAIMASGCLKLLFPEATTMGQTLPSGPLIQTFILEIILTFFLMFVIINVANGSKEVGIMAGLAIGLTVLLEAAFAGPITGASMNPARSIGPALLAGDLSHLWIYILAPIIGSILAILAWRTMRSSR